MTRRIFLGMMLVKTMREMLPGEMGTVRRLDNKGPIRRRLLDIGLIRGTWVECVGRSSAGDPAAYRIRGAVIAIRGEDAGGIWIDEGGMRRGTDCEFDGQRQRGQRADNPKEES